jgi:hypothetical protein
VTSNQLKFLLRVCLSLETLQIWIGFIIGITTDASQQLFSCFNPSDTSAAVIYNERMNPLFIPHSTAVQLCVHTHTHTHTHTHLSSVFPLPPSTLQGIELECETECKAKKKKKKYIYIYIYIYITSSSSFVNTFSVELTTKTTELVQTTRRSHLGFCSNNKMNNLDQ